MTASATHHNIVETRGRLSRGSNSSTSSSCKEESLFDFDFAFVSMPVFTPVSAPASAIFFESNSSTVDSSLLGTAEKALTSGKSGSSSISFKLLAFKPSFVPVNSSLIL